MLKNSVRKVDVPENLRELLVATQSRVASTE